MSGERKGNTTKFEHSRGDSSGLSRSWVGSKCLCVSRWGGDDLEKRILACYVFGGVRQEQKKHKYIQKCPDNPPSYNSLCGGSFLEHKGEEATPHKKLGLSNLYVGGASILYVGILSHILSSLARCFFDFSAPQGVPFYDGESLIGLFP